MGLSPRILRFCRLVASGMRQTDARIAAFGDAWPPAKRASHSQQASRLMRRPDVRAAVAEYTEQLMPVADMRVAAQEMERNLYDLALHSPDDRVRLDAARALIEICEKREGQQRTAKAVNVDELISEIGGLTEKGKLDLEALDDRSERQPPAPSGDRADARQLRPR
jgi:hypothetical protein